MRSKFFIAVFLIASAAHAQTWFPYRVKDKFGYVDAKGNWALNPLLSYAAPFSEGKAFVRAEGWGGYIREGNRSWVISDTLITGGERMRGGFAVIRKKHTRISDDDYQSDDEAAIDSSGKYIIPFSEKFASVRRMEQLRIFVCSKSSAGKQIYNVYTYDGLRIKKDFTAENGWDDDCVLGMGDNGKYWLYGKNAKPLLGYQVDNVVAEPWGASLTLDKKSALLNKEGNLILPFNYKRLYVSKFQPYAKFTSLTADSSAYINLDNGKIAFTYTAILSNPVADNAAILSYVNNLHNVYDLTGHMTGQLVSYEDTSRARQSDYTYHFFDMHFSEGVVAIRNPDNRWYAYDKYGKKIFDAGFEDEFWIYKGVSIMSEKGKKGLINARGEFIIPAEYDGIRRTDDRTHFVLTKAELQGLADNTGKILIKPAYIRLEECWDGLYSVYSGDTDNFFYGYYNSISGTYYFTTEK